MTDQTREQLVLDLVRDEGTGPIHKDRLMPYLDSTGHLTVGFGRNIDERGISLHEAEFLLHNDVKDTLRELNERLPWVADLDPVRQRVLANMAFNLGVPGLLEFKRTLKAVKLGDYALAAEGMRESLWYRQVKSRGERLAVMMKTGVTA
jgi:lysozyme